MAAVVDAAFPVMLGEVVGQRAAIVPPFGEAAIEPGYAVPANGLGLISPTDAWLTGRTAGLPGTATVMAVRQPNGRYAHLMLGAANTLTEDTVRNLLVGAVVSVVAFGVIGAIATASRARR